MNAHRTNVLVTSCLKTPVDPQTKAPLALYERERVLPYSSASHMDNRDYDRERERYDHDHDDYSGSELSDRDSPGKGRRPAPKTRGRGARGAGARIDLRQFYFSNEEYYRKLEQLKTAHLRTMAELESMYRKKLEVKAAGPLGDVEAARRPPWTKSSPAAARRLKKSHSAAELRTGAGLSDASDEEGGVAADDDHDVEKGSLSSPKEHIKNMWRDFELSPRHARPSSSSLQSLPGDGEASGTKRGGKGRKNAGAEREAWRPRVTVPEPFHMTVREAEKRRRGVKTRSEVELENADLRRRLDELTECRRQFRASPAPAHARLPLLDELRERRDERRRAAAKEREEERRPGRPFSFLERERLKRERREEELRLLGPPAPPAPPSDREGGAKPFKAKPVPRAVYGAASGALLEEERLYRAIKTQMRAEDLLRSAAAPPSTLARRLSARKRADGGSEDDGAAASPHRPKINAEVPDFDASYRRFRKQLDKRRDVRPLTACEPFQLRTSRIAQRRRRDPADAEKERAAAAEARRWPYGGRTAAAAAARTPDSSLCSSLSGSAELLPAKVTDAAKRRQEAVRKVLEQRKEAEEEEERWRERQKQREKTIQRMVSKRAQANDPHLALAQTCQTKLKEFRKQDLQRRKEYKEEMREMQQRVNGRPLLLEQAAQRNAKQAAEKRYTDALRSCGLSEDFVNGKVPKTQRPDSPASSMDSKLSDKETDAPVVYNKVYLDDDDGEPETRDEDEEGEADPAGLQGRYSDDCDEEHHSDGGYHYSDDDDHYSEGRERPSPQDDRNEDGDIIKKCQSSPGDSQHRQNSQNSAN